VELVLGLTGSQWATFGAAVAFIGGGIGSSMGIAYVANVGAGILAEDPDKFGRVLPIIAMPGTQGIYGFITAFLVWIFFLQDPEALVDAGVGAQVFFACLPVAIGCLFSGMYQGYAGTGAAGFIGRRPEMAGRAIILPALVETYAVLSLIITILLLLQIGGLI
jgi:V/A-type H+/Na+-transporting ATPase subunit K